jgi:hypothetical protein
MLHQDWFDTVLTLVVPEMTTVAHSKGVPARIAISGVDMQTRGLKAFPAGCS